MQATYDDPASGARPRSGDAQTLTVAILGDKALCSACLRLLLKECDSRIVAADSAGAIPTAGVADVAILPLLCPHAGSLSAIGELVQALNGVPLVVLVDSGDPHLVNQLVALGARGVLTFDLEVPLLAAALRLVDAGGIYVPPNAGLPQAPAVAPPADPASKDRLTRLSPREHAVLDLLRRSLSNREIAAALGIAEATVKIHVRNLLRKTRARNRVELALLAARSAG